MASEKIEEISNEKLQNRKRFSLILIGIFVGVALVWVGLIIGDLISKKQIEKSTISGLVAPLAFIWLPIMMLNKVNDELKRRRDS